VLPLWQPWASLVVHGAKRVETRHWPAPASIIGERIAIHATKTRAELGMARVDPFRTVMRDLLERGIALMDPQDPTELPLGALIGTVVVTGCNRMTIASTTALEHQDPVEYAFGHHAPGRYAWALADPQPLPTPVPWRGSQGIFSVPAEVLGIRVPPPAQGALL